VRGDLPLGISWGVDSGVATTEVMRRERQKADNIVSGEEVTVRNQLAACPRNIPFPTIQMFTSICPLWLTPPPLLKLARRLVCISCFHLTQMGVTRPPHDPTEAEFSEHFFFNFYPGSVRHFQ
jgi:hypothetical protein